MTVFLTKEQVLAIHQDQIARSGGLDGLSDEELLESALAAPQAGYGLVRYFPDERQMAGVLTYALIKNHPFLDANKRTAAVSGRVFLRMNNWNFEPSPTEFYNMVIGLADGSKSREEFIEFVIDNTFPVTVFRDST